MWNVRVFVTPGGSPAGKPAVEGVAGVLPRGTDRWSGVCAPRWYRSGAACLCIGAVAIAFVVVQVLGVGAVTDGPARVVVLRNTVQGMRASVSDTRFALSGAHGLRLDLSSPALGRSGELRSVRGSSAPSVDGNVVTLAAPAITEWFANRAWGVEQGFTLPYRLAGGGALVISQVVSGNAVGRAEAGGSDVTFSSRAGVLRYDDLVVTDAHGNPVPARLGVGADRLTITITDAHAVYPLRVDPVMVTPVTQSPASNADTGLNPVSVAFSPGGGLLATSNVQDSSVSTFSVNDATGALTPLGQTVSGGAYAYGVAFSPDGRLLATANSTYGCAPTCNNGSVSTFQVGATGGLTLASTVDAGMQPQSVTFTPNGRFLATANVYSNSVSVFGVDDTTGALTPVTQSPATNANTGTYPYSAAFSPSGGLLAVPNDGAGTVSMFLVNDMTGALTPVAQSPASNADAGTAPVAVAFSPSGGLLAVANSESSALSIFQVNQATGVLTPVTQTPASNADTGGSTGVAFNAGGALLAVSNASGSVSLFQVDATTGELTPASNASTGAADSDPFGVAFSPCGGLLSTANQHLDTMSMFTISGDSAATLLPGCTSATSGGAGGSGGSGGSGSGSPTGLPVETGTPTISGTAHARDKLTCSTGTWTNDPTGFTYQWYRDGTPIQGAAGRTYIVQAGDEQLTLTCSVTASNANGAGSAASSAKTARVPVPHVARCPAATGKLAGVRLGLVRLGMTRVQARHAYTESSNRGKRYQDFFCLTPIGIRVGYASPKLLTTVPKRERKSLAQRVIWASTASAYYTANGIRVGATIGAAGKALKLTGPIKLGANDWYLAPERSSTIVLKVRRGLIQEVGIGDRALTLGAKAQRNFLESFS
jgi:6-phosphogluconolactonase (cycloisomerase 2 family)